MQRAAFCALTCDSDLDQDLLVGSVKRRWPVSARAAELHREIVATKVRASLRLPTERPTAPDLGPGGGTDTEMGETDAALALHLPLSEEEVYQRLQGVEFRARAPHEAASTAHIAYINGVSTGFNEFARVHPKLNPKLHPKPTS
jgi:hypothetical protein